MAEVSSRFAGIRIAVSGGGLAGRLLAWHLVGQGAAVTLFDKGARDGCGSAAYAAAAMLAPVAEAAEATPLAAALGRRSLPLWRGIVGRLARPVFMQQNGSLIVWHPQDKPLAEQFRACIRRASGGVARMETWRAADILANEPQLAGRFQTGLYLPQEGQLDGRQVLAALADALDGMGVVCHWHTECCAARLAAQFDWVADCRGLGAQADWNGGGQSRLRGVRGEIVRVYAPEVSLARPVRLLHPRYPLYIAPKENHLFVIGATQLESESAAPVSVRSGLELLSALYAVHPAFGEAQLLEAAAALRPTLNHHNPEIRYDRDARIIAVNGLFRHGFMIAPAVTVAAAGLLSALVGGGPVPGRDAESGIDYVSTVMPV